MINIVAQEEILEATEKDFHVKYLFVLVDMNQFSEELKGLKKVTVFKDLCRFTVHTVVTSAKTSFSNLKLLKNHLA